MRLDYLPEVAFMYICPGMYASRLWSVKFEGTLQVPSLPLTVC